MRHLVSLFRVDGNGTTILPRYVAVIQAILLKRAMQDVPFEDSRIASGHGHKAWGYHWVWCHHTKSFSIGRATHGWVSTIQDLYT